MVVLQKMEAITALGIITLVKFTVCNSQECRLIAAYNVWLFKKEVHVIMHNMMKHVMYMYMYMYGCTLSNWN